jgi:phenol hydroxylase P4 protein
MAVTATKPYPALPKDGIEHYHGNQLVYASWDHHLMFAAPFILCISPETPFGELIGGPIAQLIAPDPDAASIDWTKVEWLRANQPFAPDFAKSLAANGVRHKDQLRFRTPGLNSLCGGTS